MIDLRPALRVTLLLALLVPFAVACVGGPTSLALAGAAATPSATARAPAPLRGAPALLGLLTVGLASSIPWPLSLALPLLAYGALVRVDARLAPSPGWRARGRFATAWIVAFAVVSGVALVGWVALAAPDLRAARALLPDVQPAWLALAGLGFALGNAALEELLFRGVLQDRFTAALRPAVRSQAGAEVVACAAQGLAFGVLHWHGFPSGPVGAALAAIYGAGLGALRRTSGGLLSPWIAHVVADLVIFAVLALHAGK